MSVDLGCIAKAYLLIADTRVDGMGGKRRIDLMPGRLAPREHVSGWLDPRVIVERPKCDDGTLWRVQTPDEELRAAPGAEQLFSIRRGLIDAEMLFAINLQGLGRDKRIRRKGCAVSSAAHRAVAVLCKRDRAVYGVPNRSAEAASCEHEVELPVQSNVGVHPPVTDREAAWRRSGATTG